MTGKKLAKRMKKVYLAIGEYDETVISIEKDELVKITEKSGALTCTYFVKIVADEIIVFTKDKKGKSTDKIAISTKQFKRLTKAICSVKRL